MSPPRVMSHPPPWHLLSQVQCKLLTACILCFVFMVVEIVGGYLARRYEHVQGVGPCLIDSHPCLTHAGPPHFRSVAIMADAAHMLSDVAGLGVSLFAAWAVSRKSHINYRYGSPERDDRSVVHNCAPHLPTSLHTYVLMFSFGYHRAEIIGALLSTIVIWAVTGGVA